MNLKKTLSGLLTNKLFLYFVVAISSLNLIGYLSMDNQDAVIFFSLVGFLMYNFSKNMIVVLLVALISTNLMTSIKGTVEGLDGTENSGTTTPVQRKQSSGQSLSIDGFENNEEEHEEKEQHEEKEKKEKKESKEPTGAEKGRYIDYAATLEEAYQNLQNSIDAGGMQQLSEDTKRLMQSQADLLNSNNSAVSPESIGKLMEQAKEMIKGLDKETIDKFAGLAESFNNNNL